MKLSLLFLSLVCSCQLFSQVYKFNRQMILTFTDEHKSHADTWFTPITVEIKKNIIILRRPPTEAGERSLVDTLQIKDTGKERRDKRDNFTKYKIKDGRILIVYGDEYITMRTKETKDHKRVEYVFYNQTNE